MNPNEQQPAQMPQPNQAPLPPSQPIMQPEQPPTPPPQVGQHDPLATLPTQPIYNQSQATMQPSASPAQTPQPNSKKKLIMVVTGAVVAALIVVLAVVLLSHSSKPAAPTSTSQNPEAANTSANATTTKKSACQLFTLTDAQSLLGSDTTLGAQSNPRPTSNGGTASSCAYLSPSSGNVITINILVASNSDGSAAQDTTLNSIQSESGLTPINGLGDRALYGNDNGAVYMYVKKGDVLITISAQSGSSQSTLSKIVQTIISNF